MNMVVCRSFSFKESKLESEEPKTMFLQCVVLSALNFHHRKFVENTKETKQIQFENC